ncbi:helix-turn-helix domain-containing protein [Providencia hangzhouensis]|uniref:DNA-binding transcriptional regulator Nlp n=1 Tax=Providencia rettgeri TaxID=587 RepID=A0A9N8D2U3_PRORE|nr:helix-turn-helix transcriptional regulator [Providencia rettgeri]EMB3083542.1 helix-turn-helix domain-containing protein [Providencia rettgeri]CAB5646177.1 DNA-binding transcriptional regulator Nlp [Providencia rettgeri]CAB5712784.1 DNA-binding transcriptional regulator Nlp [Providencia rettgeri]CAC9219997.1 DNA-binding transcriptional regulator Nlp [Providencia rettgeri]CAC9269661.1 DNA-binding transcriptional regulator Nlp [Providencia rettgeri]
MINPIASQKIALNGSDWHRADIIAALKKRGTSLARVSRDAGLNSRTLNNALDRPWPKGERLIAEAIGISPSLIWPSRYLSKLNVG